MGSRPSKGIYISAWVLLVFSFLQLLFIKSMFREFSFLPKPLLWVCVIYICAYYLMVIIAADGVLKLKSWARGLLIILLLLGIVDKVLFVPLRLKGLERVNTDPQLRGLLVQQYRKMLVDNPPAGQVSDDILMNKISADLHTAQKGIEITWVFFYLALLAFYSNPTVRSQFRNEE